MSDSAEKIRQAAREVLRKHGIQAAVGVGKGTLGIRVAGRVALLDPLWRLVGVNKRPKAPRTKVGEKVLIAEVKDLLSKEVLSKPGGHSIELDVRFLRPGGWSRMENNKQEPR